MCIRLGGQVSLPAVPSHCHKGFDYFIVQGYLMVKDNHFKARCQRDSSMGEGTCPKPADLSCVEGENYFSNATYPLPSMHKQTK